MLPIDVVFGGLQACADAAVTGQVGVRRENHRTLAARRINLGEVLRLDEPLSFWGGLDPSTGEIIDQAHPQAGASMAGAVVAMPGSRGSSGTPGFLGEALRTGAGPAALIVTKADINLVAGAMVAESLYGVDCPVLLVDGETFASLTTGRGSNTQARVRWLTDGVTGLDDNDYLRRILTADVYDIAVETPLDDAPSLSARTDNRVLLEGARTSNRSSRSRCAVPTTKWPSSAPGAARPRSHLLLSRKPRSRGSLAAAELGCRAVIVMPVTTPTLKVDARLRACGAEVAVHGESYSDAETEAHRLMAEQGLEFVHPFDDPDVIAGQGTIAMELLRQHPGPIDAVFVATRGRRAGSRASPPTTKSFRPDIRIIGVQTEDSDAIGLKCRCG